MGISELLGSVAIGLLINFIRIHCKRLSNGGAYSPHDDQSIKDYWNRFRAWIIIQARYRHVSDEFQYLRRGIASEYNNKFRYEKVRDFDPPSYIDMIEVCKEFKRLDKNANDDGFEEWIESIRSNISDQISEDINVIYSCEFFNKDGMQELIKYLKKQ